MTPLDAPHTPAADRYEQLPYRRSGHSGLQLPAISLGLWHNFGGIDSASQATALLCHAFDRGITHFDLANNYGPPPGSAELLLGQVLRGPLRSWRDELIISTKAGYRMGPGPYGDGGSRKYLLTSLDQSLQRMGLDHVDVFYHHRPAPDTPLEETMEALAHTVRSGKALYVGLSNYPPELTRQACALLRESRTPCVLHQPRYSLLERQVEQGLLQTLQDEGVGCIAFSPLAQGQLSDKYLSGAIPADSRAAKPSSFLKPEVLTAARLQQLQALNAIAQARGQRLAQMAVSWLLRQPVLTSVLIGASRISQIDEAVAAAGAPAFSADELQAIDAALAADAVA
ncbi:aldo/keto reductase [Ideonella sp.]|uniref:aldo/keto reductase n=1 Tax=Ideonella sp. TaxID=1929293 RepID=UPI003BB81357